MQRTSKKWEWINDFKNHHTVITPSLASIAGCRILKEETPLTPKVSLGVPRPSSVRSPDACQERVKSNPVRQIHGLSVSWHSIFGTWARCLPTTNLEPGHRTRVHMSIFGLCEGPVYDCWDLSLNWALKDPFAGVLQGFFLFLGERLFGETFFRSVAGGIREKRGQVQKITMRYGKNVTRVTKALSSEMLLLVEW